MNRIVLCLTLTALATTTAFAQPKKKKAPTLADQLVEIAEQAVTQPKVMPRFAFSLGEPWMDPSQEDYALANDFELGFGVLKSTVAVAADGKAAWIAADVATYEPCGDETCPRIPEPAAHHHLTIVLDNQGGWKPVAWHVADTWTAREQAAAMKRGAMPTGLERRVLPGAEDAVKLFESSLGDPKVLAATVSKRADVVLYGSDLKERYVGGKKVAATLAKWNLGFKLRDGVQAGVTGAGNVAWVAANVDARSMKKPGAAATPYRVMFVYEKAAAGWQLVQAHFSFDT